MTTNRSPLQTSGIEYLLSTICKLYKAQNLPPDFILWFAKLFWPEFKVVDGRVFVAELFDAGVYREHLSNGQSQAATQFWLNLLEVTGVFDDLSNEQAIIVAESLSKCWNAKLHDEFDGPSELARVIEDKETGEIFVAIGTPGYARS